MPSARTRLETEPFRIGGRVVIASLTISADGAWCEITLRLLEPTQMVQCPPGLHGVAFLSRQAIRNEILTRLSAHAGMLDGANNVLPGDQIAFEGLVEAIDRHIGELVRMTASDSSDR